MKFLRYLAIAYAACTLPAAHAAGELVQSCSPYGPYGNTIQGWAMVGATNDFSCGVPNGVRYLWKNLNGSPYGALEIVCGIYNLPNWWPVSYRSSLGTSCYNLSQWQYTIEYRGN